MPDLATIIERYPPVPASSDRQKSIETLLLEAVSPSSYKSFGFSVQFKDTYGSPMSYYSDFKRLMTTPIPTDLLPKPKSLSDLDNGNSMFLWFCRAIDNKANQWGWDIVTRPTMETLYVSYAMLAFESDKVQMAQEFKDNAAERGKLQAVLCSVIKKRFSPETKVEEYWREKGEKFGLSGGDVDFRGEGCDEDPKEMKLVGDSDDENCDEDMMDAKDDREELAMGVDSMHIDD